MRCEMSPAETSRASARRAEIGVGDPTAQGDRRGQSPRNDRRQRHHEHDDQGLGGALELGRGRVARRREGPVETGERGPHVIEQCLAREQGLLGAGGGASVAHGRDGGGGERLLPVRGLAFRGADERQELRLVLELPLQRRRRGLLLGQSAGLRLEEGPVAGQDVAPDAGLLIDVGEQELIGLHVCGVDLGGELVPGGDQIGESDRALVTASATTSSAAMAISNRSRTRRPTPERPPRRGASGGGLAGAGGATASTDRSWTRGPGPRRPGGASRWRLRRRRASCRPAGRACWTRGPRRTRCR